jgi:hypothetical protein
MTLNNEGAEVEIDPGSPHAVYAACCDYMKGIELWLPIGPQFEAITQRAITKVGRPPLIVPTAETTVAELMRAFEPAAVTAA